MLSHFENLYEHIREHREDKDHNNTRHVHKQELYRHNVTLAFNIQ